MDRTGRSRSEFEGYIWVAEHTPLCRRGESADFAFPAVPGTEEIPKEIPVLGRSVVSPGGSHQLELLEFWNGGVYVTVIEIRKLV